MSPLQIASPIFSAIGFLTKWPLIVRGTRGASTSNRFAFVGRLFSFIVFLGMLTLIIVYHCFSAPYPDFCDPRYFN